MCPATPTATPLALPTPDEIRAAIDAADQHAKWLRRLLRLALTQHVALPPARTHHTRTVATSGEGTDARR